MSEFADLVFRTSWPLKAAALVVAALWFDGNHPLMAQSAGANPQLGRADVVIEATPSSTGATLTIASKAPQDEAARARTDAYGKLLAERLPSNELEPLLSLLPADTELAKRLKASPVAFTVSHSGGMIRVELIASDQSSRTTIHEYVQPVLAEKAQRRANHPGSNLGWDAPRDADVRK